MSIPVQKRELYRRYINAPWPLPPGRQFYQDDCDTAFKRGYNDPLHVNAVAGTPTYTAWAAGRDRGRWERGDRPAPPKVNGRYVFRCDLLSYWKDGFDKETQRPTQDLCYAVVVSTYGSDHITAIDWEGNKFSAMAESFFKVICEPEEIAEILSNHFAQVREIVDTAVIGV